VRRQRASRAFLNLALDVEDATNDIAHTQRDDVIQLDRVRSVTAAVRNWDHAALAVMEFGDLKAADLPTLVRLTAGMLRVADPAWLPSSSDLLLVSGATRADLAVLALYRAANRIADAAGKGGAK